MERLCRDGSAEAWPANADRCVPRRGGASLEARGDDLSVSKAMEAGVMARIGLGSFEE